MRLAGHVALLACVALASSTGCARIPSPLTPAFSGSIGLPHRGVLTDATRMADDAEAWTWLRHDDHHYAIPRFEELLERAAKKVEEERPGARLVVGDLSREHGGQLLPHLSHRSGRDGDLLLYMTTLEGVPVESPGFVAVGLDGLAFDKEHHRFLRFDVEREWLLIRTLLTDESARVQWIFANRKLQGLLLEYARARGEPWSLLAHASQVLLEPHPGGPHDDHVHVRIACTAAELATGCEWNGPVRPWFAPLTNAPLPSDRELARELFAELPAP